MKSSFLIWMGCLGMAMAANLPPATPEETLALAERTLEYVAKSVDAKTLKPYAEELKVDREWLRGATNNPAYRAGVAREIARLRRRILFLHPDLQFDRLLAVRRGIPYHYDPHEVDQYVGRYSRPGPGLVAIDNWRNVPLKRVILEGKLPEGTVLNPDLHWNADRVLFAFCDHTAKPKADGVALKIHADIERNFRQWHRSQDPTSPLADPTGDGQRRSAHLRYFIYEAAVDGSWVRQITGGADDPMETKDARQTVLIEDVDPCYLPDGGFVFTSTRGQNFGRCHWGRWTPSFLLYRGELPPVGERRGASAIRQLSFGEANEWEPTVLDDGRIAYTRWDYINRNAIWHQSLWTTRPDGTGTAHLYGNYTENLCVETELKTIPGSKLLVGTAAAHHNLTSGSLFLLDVAKGDDGLAPITRLTPECPFPESEGWKLGGTFSGPMPVNDTLFFCAYSDDPLSFPRAHPRATTTGGCGAAWPRQAAYGIYLVDTLGGRELIFQDGESSTFNPIPVVRRKMPPRLASVLPPRDLAPTSGVCYVENVYETRTDLPKGSVKALRVNKILNLPICRRRTSNPGRDLDLYKETLGTVPVSAAGAAAFRIPAGEPIQLQALDKDGKAILTMRSFIYSQRGEIQGCIGCHEQKNASLPKYAEPPEGARLGKVDDPVPEVDLGYSGPVSFRRSVQPIFDAKCIACHGLMPTNSPNAAFPLTADVAVAELVKRKLVANILSYSETHFSKCYDYFAGASKLWKKLANGHGPKLTADEGKKIILWLDQGVSIYASAVGYGWNGPEAREVDAQGEKLLREEVRESLGEAAAAWPLDALVNRADESLSHVLDLVPGAERTKFLGLCEGVFKPMKWHDIAGTCGRDDECECRSCWVRRAGYNRPASPVPSARDSK